MVIKSKDELKTSLATGQKPTGDTFANLIDSTILTVNGQQPDTAGNVAITIPDLTAHAAIQGGEDTFGHVQIQNFIGPNPTRAITAQAVKNLQDTLQAEDTRLAGLITALTSRVEALENPSGT